MKNLQRLVPQELVPVPQWGTVLIIHNAAVVLKDHRHARATTRVSRVFSARPMILINVFRVALEVPQRLLTFLFSS